MNTEILVTLGVVYVIGFYVTAFLLGMFEERLNLKFDCDDWLACMVWPISASMLIVVGLVVGLSKLYKLAFSRIGSRFPATTRFVKKTLFAVSLLFRPAKFGELVGKRIRNRDAKMGIRGNENKMTMADTNTSYGNHGDS